VSGRYFAKVVDPPKDAERPRSESIGAPPLKKRKHAQKEFTKPELIEKVQNNDDEEDETLAIGKSFRSYRLPSNHHRKTRDEHIAEFSWEIKTPHYIKDDFVSYLNDELQFQL